MSTSENLKVGSMVRLKTGGPIMTVCRLVEGDAICKWFVEMKRPFDGMAASAVSEWIGPYDAAFGRDALAIVEAK
jgi:uncharacterized protein YodC (DUF2158 family)